MDIYSAMQPSSAVLGEQIARELFQVLPEDGPVMAILDRDWNCRPSDTERFSQLKLSETLLRDLCGRIDDGQEPVMTQSGEHSVVASALTTGDTDCGYIIIALSQQTPEATLAGSLLIETILNQISLILRLIEKNVVLFNQRMRRPGIQAGVLIRAN